MSTTMEVGKKLVAFCQKGQNLQAIETLYDDKIVSVEAMSGDETMPQRMEGIAAVKGKNEWWLANHEIHSSEARGPFPKDDRFIVLFTIDVTAKDGPMKGQRMQMEEAGLYTVKNGKIVQEEFFYHMG